jgi:hypothetical protein
MSKVPAGTCDRYARECLRLAEQDGLPENDREALLDLAREWQMTALGEQAPARSADKIDTRWHKSTP